jgi:hypothetical protein
MLLLVVVVVVEEERGENGSGRKGEMSERGVFQGGR